MIETLVALAALTQWLTFGPAPLADQVAEGRRVYAKGKGIERTLQDGRSVIGVWFDGRIKDDVESMVWISPRMASRWFGYLEAKEKWPKGEMIRRWSDLRSQLNGRLCFVVRLSAMPHLVTLDMESEGKPSDADIQNPVFSLTTGPGYVYPQKLKLRGLLGYPRKVVPINPLPNAVVAVECRLLARWQDRDRSKLEKYRWHQDTPVANLFAGRNEEPQKDLGFGLGDYTSTWYWVAFDPKSIEEWSCGLDVWVSTVNKERVGEFRL